MTEEYLEKLKQVLRGRIAIYIDAANLERSVKDMWVNPKEIPPKMGSMTGDKLAWRVDYERLKGFFENLGYLVEIRFYSADFQTENHGKFLTFLKKRLGITLCTKFLKQYLDHTPEHPHRKANFDVEISVDATHAQDTYETLVLFSGDCDFEYLLKFLRGRGKTVVVFSRVGHVAKELPPAASAYFDIADFRHQILRVTKKFAKQDAKNPA